MISNDVIKNAEAIRNRYQEAKPFKHACIEAFFEADVAEALLTDFPPFDREKARNEFGEIGGKAVNTDLRSISPFYEKLYRYLFSQEFMNRMSEITGIPDLIGDPAMYGGGTHENCHGQELDPHVDFNYVSGGEAHRRVNLLVYLNKGWNPAWGGAIEIHSNPREPETNQIKPYDLKFNRAVIFETNEYSWHGFPRVNLPPEHRHDSRKCLSIYLYTKTRPQEEIAGTHGTFYVQRPLPKHLQPGHVLSEQDVLELKRGFRNRDRYIEAYQRTEEQVGRERDNMIRYIGDIMSSIRLPTIGYVRQTARVSGNIYHDGWVGPEVSVQMEALRNISKVILKGSTPESFPKPPGKIQVTVGANSTSKTIMSPGIFEIEVACDIKQNETFQLSLASENTTNLKQLGLGEDDRDFGIYMNAIVFEEDATLHTGMTNTGVAA